MSLFRQRTFACPHCHVPYRDTPHICADKEKWTQAERDQWRDEVRIRRPAVHFTPNSAELADRLGAYSQRSA